MESCALEAASVLWGKRICALPRSVHVVKKLRASRDKIEGYLCCVCCWTGGVISLWIDDRAAMTNCRRAKALPGSGVLLYQCPGECVSAGW